MINRIQRSLKSLLLVQLKYRRVLDVSCSRKKISLLFKCLKEDATAGSIWVLYSAGSQTSRPDPHGGHMTLKLGQIRGKILV